MALIGCFGPAAAAQQAPVAAPAPVNVTVDDAVQRALQVQPAMVQAQGGVRTAGAAVRSAYGAFLPTVTASAGASRSTTAAFGQGATVTGANEFNYTGSLNLSLDLFTGFRRLFNRGATTASADAADAGLISQRYAVILQTKQLFYGALADSDLVTVAQANLRRTQEELDIATQKVRAGSGTRSDSLTAAVDYGNAQIALLQAQANLATAEANLGRQIGVDGPVRARADTTLPATPDTSALRGQAIASAPLVVQADANARSARAAQWSARSTYWPTLNLSFNDADQGAAGTATFHTAAWRFGLSWTLFNGFAREQQQVTAAVSSDIADAQAADARLNVNAQVTQLVAAVYTASAQIGISQANVASATEAARVQSERYRVGAATFLDYLTAEASLTTAQVNLVQARFNYLIARASLEALVGRAL